MQISLRSQVIAGAAAVIGASAIAITPVMQPAVQLPSLHSSSVELAALANPFWTALASLNLVVNDVFNPYDTYDPPDVPFVMYQGMIPEFIYNALPVPSSIGYNWSYYIGNALTALITGPYSTASVIVTALWDLPSSVITAVGQALGGDFSGAVTTLYNAIIAPIGYAVDGVVNAVSTVVGGIVTNALNVLGALPSIASGLVNTTITALQTLTQVAVGVGTNIISALTSLNFEGAWNAAVDGLLGPSGFPGYLESLTLGPGLGTVGIDYASSFRVWGEGSVFTIANALGGSYPSAAAVAPAAGAAPALRSAAAVESAAAAEESAGSGLSGVHENAAADAGAGLPSGSDTAGSNSTAPVGSDSSSNGDSAGVSSSGSDAAGGPKAGHRAGSSSAQGGGAGHANKAHGAARKAS